MKNDPKYSILINKAANSINDIIRGLNNESEEPASINYHSIIKQITNGKSIIVFLKSLREEARFKTLIKRIKTEWENFA